MKLGEDCRRIEQEKVDHTQSSSLAQDNRTASELKQHESSDKMDPVISARMVKVLNINEPIPVSVD